MINLKKSKWIGLGAIIFNFSFAYSQYYDSNYPYNSNYYYGSSDPYYGAGNSYDYNSYPYNSNYSYNSHYSNYPYGRYQENEQTAKYRDDLYRPGSSLPDMNDWDYHESWREHREAFFKGETQPEAVRRSHPYGEGGVGYDPDPLYLKMKENYAQLKIEKAEAERRSAEAERRTAEAERRVAEAERRALSTAKTQTDQKISDQSDVYTVRTGGGRSQKGKASQRNAQQQRGGGSAQRNPTNYQNKSQNYNDNPYGRDPYYNDNPYGRDPYYSGDFLYYR